MTIKNHGDKLLSFLKSETKFRWLPIIAVFREVVPDLVNRLVRGGISDIIAFPFNESVVSKKIDRVLRNGRKKIIIVDDEPCILDLLQNVFEINGYIVNPFSNVEDVIEYLKKNEVDAIITDIVLPGASGIDLLLHVKTTYNYLPVILITGHSGKYTPESVISMGGDGYFKKPFHNKEIVATLEAVLLRNKGVNKEVAMNETA